MWNRLYDVVHAGLGSIQNQTEQPVPRLSMFSTLFIGHTTNILPSALDDLFPLLSNYFVVKPVFDFSVVPEFLNMFYSGDIKSSRYRLFALHLLKDGMKTIEDFLFIFKTPILKSVLACFGSNLSDTETDLAILEIVKSMTHLPLATDVIIVKFGLLSWLYAVIERQETWFFDTICLIVDILENLWSAVQVNRSNYKNPDEIEIQLLKLNLRLLPKFTVKIPLNTVAAFYAIFYKSCVGRFDQISQENLTFLRNYSEVLLGEDFRYVSSVLNQGTTSEDLISFLNRLDKDQVESYPIKRILVLTRELSKSWFNSRQ